MAIVDGYFDWADRSVPGADNKVYLATNRRDGIVWHSAEGWMPYLLWSVANPAGTSSWHGSIRRDGVLFQHYGLDKCCWASGNRTANISYCAFEAEGMKDDKLTKEQIKTIQRIMTDWSAWTGKPAWREHPIRTMWEHREVDELASPNAGPTACPSERYSPVWKLMEKQETPVTVTQAEFDALTATVVRLNEAIVTRGKIHQLADDPNYAQVEEAYKLLKKGGFVQ